MAVFAGSPKHDMVQLTGRADQIVDAAVAFRSWLVRATALPWLGLPRGGPRRENLAVRSVARPPVAPLRPGGGRYVQCHPAKGVRARLTACSQHPVTRTGAASITSGGAAGDAVSAPIRERDEHGSIQNGTGARAPYGLAASAAMPPNRLGGRNPTSTAEPTPAGDPPAIAAARRPTRRSQ